MQDKRLLNLDSPVLKNTQSVLNALKIYHRHEVYGMNNVPKVGAAILITNHSLATYDGFMLGMTILHAVFLMGNNRDNLYYTYGEIINAFTSLEKPLNAEEALTKYEEIKNLVSQSRAHQ